MTPQRAFILDEFLSSQKHISVEELHRKIAQKDSTIGHTTVYRTLRLLSDAGLAREEDFGDGIKRYEYESEHHDHLICVSCKKTVEIFDNQIESMQERLAEVNGYILTGHKMDLYGICAQCMDKAPSDADEDSYKKTVNSKFMKLSPLGLLKNGTKARVISFTPNMNLPKDVSDQRKERRIQEMGLRLGKTVEILNNGARGPILLKIDELRIAIGRTAAMDIMVEVED